MAHERNRLVVQHLRRAVASAGNRQRSDKQLLEAFAGGEERAFETLVQRHGPLVLSVCRRVLRNNADADDAFQATFLVLARKAAGTCWHDAIGSWLYQVAYRVALKMRAKRGRQPQGPPPPPTTQLVNEMTLGDLRLVLDEELNRLPERYRAPLLLCYLQGKTQDEAARELGWSEGALRGCLFRAREILRTRLARRGLSVSAVLLASALSQSMAEAAVPSQLVALAVTAASPYAAGQTVAGLVSTTTLVLSREVLSAMFLAKLKIAALVLLAVGAVGTTAGIVLHPVLAEHGILAGADEPAADNPPADDEDERQVGASDDERERRDGQRGDERERPAGTLAGVITAINTTKTPHSIAVRLGEVVVSFDVAADARLVVEGRPAVLADLKIGQRVALTFAADQRTVAGLRVLGLDPRQAAERPREGGERPREGGERPREGERPGDGEARRGRFAYGAVTDVNVDTRTIALARLMDGGGRGPVTTYPLAAEVQVIVDRMPGELAELKDCKVARAELNAEGKVFRVWAEWAGRDDPRGTIQSIDAANNEFTLMRGAEPEREGEGGAVKLIGRPVVYTLTKDARVFINGRAGKLADLKVGQPVVIRTVADDQVSVIRTLAVRDQRREDPERREGGERRPEDPERREGAPRERDDN